MARLSGGAIPTALPRWTTPLDNHIGIGCELLTEIETLLLRRFSPLLGKEEAKSHS